MLILKQNQDKNKNTGLTQSCNGEFKPSMYTWFMIIFLCLLWPLMIMLFFSSPSGDQAIDLTNILINVYLPTVIMQGLVMVMLYLTTRTEGTSLKSLSYGRPKIIHIIQAILFLLISSIILYKLKGLLIYLNFFTFDEPTALLLGDSTSFKIIWVIFSAIVAFIEESAYRGYLISRLTKMSGSKVAGVLVASAGFAFGHLYQGTGGAVLLFFYALMFAVLFLWTKSLWPCILAHFLHNSLAAFIDKVPS
jgi:membrane protease YdiL (CAAX protease family)